MARILSGFNQNSIRIQSEFGQDSVGIRSGFSSSFKCCIYPAAGIGKRFSMGILTSNAAIEKAAFVYLFQVNSYRICLL